MERFLAKISGFLSKKCWTVEWKRRQLGSPPAQNSCTSISGANNCRKERSNGMSSGLRSPEFSLCSNPTASLSSFIRKGRRAKAIKAKILLKIGTIVSKDDLIHMQQKNTHHARRC